MEDRPNPQVREYLESRIADAGLLKPYRPKCHDVGQVLTLQATGVFPAHEAELDLEILKQIGGGFAGQVYRVRLLEQRGDAPIEGLEAGQVYALKILIPPSTFSRMFRDVLYAMAYQGPFSAQVNPDAIRAGALWQKLIRRGAALSLGSEKNIVDVHATLFDPDLCSYGEISEWVEGRTWRFEIDEHLLKRMRLKLDTAGGIPDDQASQEYLRKKVFMAEVVRHFHGMGAPELARQYEWWTCKSQPNALRRIGGDDLPHDGLCAIDFRAGLALLPFLPMSPGDFPLILRGLFRGRLVQFDRGNMGELDRYLVEHEEHFAHLRPAVAELEQREAAYRASLPDITHHHVKLLQPELRRSVREGFITSWKTKALVDDEHTSRLRSSTLAFGAFLLVGLLPLVSRPLRRIWGDPAYAQHVKRTLTEWGYFKARFVASQHAKLIDWHRDEKVTDERARALADRPLRTWWLGVVAGWLPGHVHRFFTDWAYCKERLWSGITYPFKLYFDNDFREDWLRDQIEEGRDDGMLSNEEADAILERIKEPFIQKYLRSVAVHACTAPITQVVAAVVAVYAMLAYGNSWAEGMALAAVIFAIFQGTPISPGSIVRGSYVAFMMIKDRDVKNYWVAGIISFWHYVGYLAFPFQMVAKYPDLARFMAGNWATKMVRIIPVFGEKGALAEHWIYDAFFNTPISFRRWVLGIFRRRKEPEGAGS